MRIGWSFRTACECTARDWKAAARSRAQSASRPSGFIRAAGRSCARTVRPCWFRHTQKTAERSRRAPAFISSMGKGVHGVSGLEGGRPKPGAIGVAPEWFYKGCGTILRAHGEALLVPPFAEDGGEEPEIAGIYIVD